MLVAPGSVFGDAEFFVYLVLRARVPEAQHYVGDQRALRRHVETKREAKDLDLVQLRGESGYHEAEEHPQSHDDPHQPLVFFPVLIALRVRECSHVPLLFVRRERSNGLPDNRADASRASLAVPLGKTLGPAFTLIAALQIAPARPRRSRPSSPSPSHGGIRRSSC